MISSKPVQRSPYHMSYPVNSELAPCFSSPELLASPPTTPPRAHKHSLSKPMTWLNRCSSSTSNHPSPHAAPKPIRISEPKVGSSLDQFSLHRSGPLGSGATVVRTPQEALSGSSRTFELINEQQGPKTDLLLHNHADEIESRHLPPPPSSPPLPPLPDISDGGGEGGEGEGTGRQCDSPTGIPLTDHILHPRLQGSPSPKIYRSSSRPTMLAHSRAPSRSTPALPADIDATPPQPPFEAILLSNIPDVPIDPSGLIVALETCTTTFRTSLRTLVSRPSHLSRYITSLLSPVSETASIYSNASDASLVQHKNGFNTVFRDHLADSGCLPQSSNVIHVFLDRPSGPYTHVLAYLRSLPGTRDLPRAVQQPQGAQSPSRLESLLELCDEASYLGLEALYELCRHEIDRVHRAPLQTCVGSGTLRGKTGSVRSFRTVVEQCQPHQEFRPSELRASKGSSNARTAVKSATRASSSSSSCEHKDSVRLRERSRERKGQVGSPPPGWI